MQREESIERIGKREQPWDLMVIGGGATGIGIALDAASRDLDTLLVEQADFGQGTSSRSTKLVHGGVRYLEQGNLRLVRDALRERANLRRNAPLLVRDLAFFIPCRTVWQRFYYWFGLKLYDLLAGRGQFGPSHAVGPKDAAARLPTLRPQMHHGGVIYHDGQFDDSRLLIQMARRAAEHGACLVNHMAATAIDKDDAGRIANIRLEDRESGRQFSVTAKSVINAAGPFTDQVAKLDDPQAAATVVTSQGVHVVLPQHFFPGDCALIVPRTSDGRVLFLIPWRGHVVVGTTDTPIPEAVLEPAAREEEIEFLLDTASKYLTCPPKREDVTSVFTGIRPLVKTASARSTASLSRDHTITTAPSGLISIRGGKWTTVRKMAEDCVDTAIDQASLVAGPCRTANLSLHAIAQTDGECSLTEQADTAASAGSFIAPDAAAIAALAAERPSWSEPIDKLPQMTAAEVVWAVRHEMARTVEDVLARRTRWLFLDSAAAVAAAPAVARLMAELLRRDQRWEQQQVDQFTQLAANYSLH